MFNEEEKDEKKDENSYMAISFDEILNKKFVLYDNDAIYKEGALDGKYAFDYLGELPNLEAGNNGIEIKITGILRLREDLTYGCLTSGLNFTEKLGEEFIQRNIDSKIAQYIRDAKKAPAQDGSEGTGLKTFTKPVSKTLETMFTPVPAPVEGMGTFYVLYDEKAAIRTIGGTDEMSKIQIYTSTFETKEGLLDYLEDWNLRYEDDETKQIKYTDQVGLMMSMVQTILNAITYVLVAFTAISLVVSSVMIGIITYVSVVERTKEIGVLRSLGARKKDIKNLFNAETFIIGLSSGVFGVVVTYLLQFAINAILAALTGIATLASLPLESAITMVIISVVLTLISGLIPAQAAAKKDPVVALRTE